MSGPLDGADDGGNISSAQLDQQEIAAIAGELKKGLKPAGQPPKLTVDPKAAPLPVHPAPVAAPGTTVPAADGVLHLNAKASSDAAAADDTIVIDSEGRLRPNAADEKQPKPL